MTQEHNATQMKPTTPSLEIKLPVPTEASKEKPRPASATTTHSVSDDQRIEEEEEDEDDWEAFQSFPATTNAAESESEVESKMEEPDLGETVSVLEVNTGSDYNGDSISEPLHNVKVVNETGHQEAGEGEVISETPDGMKFPQGGVIEPCGDQHRERDEEVVCRQEGTVAGPDQMTEHMPSEPNRIEHAELSVGVNIVDHQVQGKEKPDDKPVQGKEELNYKREEDKEEAAIGSYSLEQHEESSKVQDSLETNDDGAKLKL